MSKIDGGPAFPIWQQDMNLGDTAGPGLSIRDYFAAQAMTACAPAYPTVGEADEIAKFSYAMADAMLAHRARSTDGGNT